MRCRLGAGTLFLENANIYTRPSVTSLRGPPPLGGALGGSEGQKRIKKKLLKFKTSFFDLAWSNLLVVSVSSCAFFFEVIVFFILEPLGVDFELSS